MMEIFEMYFSILPFWLVSEKFVIPDKPFFELAKPFAAISPVVAV